MFAHFLQLLNSSSYHCCGSVRRLHAQLERKLAQSEIYIMSTSQLLRSKKMHVPDEAGSTKDENFHGSSIGY